MDEQWITKNGKHILIKAKKSDVESQKIKDFVAKNKDAQKLYPHLLAQYENGDEYGNGTVYKIESDDNMAIMRKAGSTLSGLISTGGGLGVEALAQTLENSEEPAISWDADTPNAQAYYRHLGLTPYKGYSLNPNVEHYTIQKSSFKDVASYLRNRKNK